MKRKRLIAAFTAALLIASSMSVPVYAAYGSSDEVKKEYTFETIEKDFNYAENQVIELDGKKYKASDIKYELISEKKRIEKTVSYNDLTSKEVPDKITTEEGEELTVEDVKYTANKVTGTKTYRDYVEAPKIPENADFTVNGKIVVGKRIDTKRKISETYNMPFTVKGMFYGDEDSMYYELNGKKIPAGTAPEFSQYKEELLTYLNLSPDIYRIDNGAWASGYYKDGDNTVRNATYSGMQKSNTYTVTYQGYLYQAEAVYSNGEENEDPVYTVKATVTYEKAGLTTLQKILAGAGIVVASGLMIAWLFALRKKKKDKAEVNTTNY